MSVNFGDSQTDLEVVQRFTGARIWSRGSLAFVLIVLAPVCLRTLYDAHQKELADQARAQAAQAAETERLVEDEKTWAVAAKQLEDLTQSVQAHLDEAIRDRDTVQREVEALAADTGQTGKVSASLSSRLAVLENQQKDLDDKIATLNEQVEKLNEQVTSYRVDLRRRANQSNSQVQ